MQWDALENVHVSLDMRKYTTWEQSKNQDPVLCMYIYKCIQFVGNNANHNTSSTVIFTKTVLFV